MKLNRIPTRRAIWTAAVALASGSAAMAQISFDTPVTYDAGSTPHCAVLADFDGDGDVDIVTAVHDPARLSLLRNDGAGEFGAPEFTALTLNTNPVGIVADDFNADGHIDVMLSYSAVDAVKYMRNLGDGHFVGGEYVVVGDEPLYMAKADFDGDGDMDVAVSNRTSNTVSFVRNLGAGSFGLMSGVAVGLSPRALDVGHFNADNLLDVAVAVHDGMRVDILRNLGTGSFQKVLSLPLGTNEKPEGLAVADIDNDGDDDILVSAADTTVHDVVVFRQVTPGTFCPCDYFDVGGTHPAGMIAADFDFDTYVDVATANTTSSNVAVLRNRIDPLFDLVFNAVMPGPSPDSVVAGDLNNDHYLDLVVTNGGGDSVTVLINARDNPSRYCSAGVNSTGYAAHIGSSGSLGVLTNDFTLQVVDAVPNVNGMFLYALTPQELPFHSGYLCVKAPIIRLAPPVVTDAAGAASRWIDFMHPVSRYAQIRAGSIWNFQFWYRDPAAPGGPTTNLSDAWRVVFEP